MGWGGGGAGGSGGGWGVGWQVEFDPLPIEWIGTPKKEATLCICH